MVGIAALNDQALIELCQLLEQENASLAPDAIWLSGKPQVYAHLKEMGALLPGMELTSNLLCRDCCSETIRPTLHQDATQTKFPYQGHCPDCGWINLAHADVHLWQVQPKKIARWLAAALQLSSSYVLESVIEGVLWRLGEIEYRRKRRTVFFGRRLAEAAAGVNAKLNELVAPGAEVIITTSDILQLRDSDLRDRLTVPLRAVAHLRKANFVLENFDIYLHSLGPVETSDETSLRLMHTQRVALIDGDKHKLSPQMFSLLKILEDADGDEVHKRHIAERLGLESATFRTVDVIKRHRVVFDTFVDSDRKGNYWLKPDFVILDRR